MSSAWGCIAVLAMLVLCGTCKDQLRERPPAILLGSIATSEEVQSTTTAAHGPEESPFEVSETPASMEIEGRAALFRFSPRHGEDTSKGADREPPAESRPSTTTTEDISVLYSLYGAPAPGILLSKEEATAESQRSVAVVSPPLEGSVRLSQLTSPLQEAINDFTYGNIQDAIHGLTKTLKSQAPRSTSRFYA